MRRRRRPKKLAFERPETGGGENVKIAEMRNQSAADLEAARERAMSDLQAEVADIVVGAAERVVEANLDAEAQTRLIENYIDQVGSD